VTATSIPDKAPASLPVSRGRVTLLLRLLGILAVIALAWGLRARAVERLPIDYDEDDYLRAGQEFAHLVRLGDWAGFLNTNYRPEHPPLGKIAYGFVLLGLPEQPLVPDLPITDPPAKSLPTELLHAARTEAAVFGTLTAFLLALLNPLGGLMLAIHTFTIKYTSQVMLDGLAALMSLSTVFCYVKYKKKERWGWLLASALFLGLAADTKFLHGTVGFAVLLDWLYTRRATLRQPAQRLRVLRAMLLWGMLAVAVFFASNPYLWPDPIARLQEALAAVHNTTTSRNVTQANYPVWQQLQWLSMPVPFQQNAAFLIPADTIIALLAIAGFKRSWKKESAFAIWLVFELVVLMLWRTRWPQYILVVTAPLAYSAGEGLAVAWRSLAQGWSSRRAQPAQVYAKTVIRRALPWLVPGLLAFALLTLVPLVFQLGISMTDFSTGSLKDGLHGGIWRAIWEGLTGRLSVTHVDIGTRANRVNYTGLTLYGPVLGFITANGVLFFNVMWTLLSVFLQAALGVAVALLLWQRGVRLGKFWQALFILPWAIPEMIGALMWSNIFQPTSGWLPLAAAKYGQASVFALIQNAMDKGSSMWLLYFLLPAMWYGFPFMMLAASVGLKSIPRQVFDACAIDGASSWQTFRYITWPLLLPLLAPALIVRGIFAFNQFYLFQIFGYWNATLATLSYNVFNPNSGYGTYGGQFALSAAINIITVVILFAFVILFNRWSKAGEGVTYA
jgi:ABC-type sugar transport system permease subunit